MKEILYHRIFGLFRTRVLLSLLGLFIVYKKPEIGHWVVAIIGLAMGVSAVDAWRGTGYGGQGAAGNTARNQGYRGKDSEP